MHHAIMVCGADLAVRPLDPNDPDFSVNEEVVPGKETARACRKAARVAKRIDGSVVYLTAGWSPRFEAWMNVSMGRCIREEGVPESRILTPKATAFNTNGEMEALVAALPEDSTVHLVCRWWHLPRAWMLLRARLRNAGKRARVRPVPVWTFWDPLGMLLEPLAWVKNARNLRAAF